MKPFFLRFGSCLMGVFTLAALECFITTPTWGAAVLLAVYAALALQCCKAADKLDARQVHREERDHEQHQKIA